MSSFNRAFATILLNLTVPSALLVAQPASANRRFDGWIAASNSVQQTVFYQNQTALGGQSGLNALPAHPGFGGTPTTSAASAGQGLPALPPSIPDAQNGTIPAAQRTALPLPQNDGAGASIMPGPRQLPGNPPPASAAGAAANPAIAQDSPQILPPSNPIRQAAGQTLAQGPQVAIGSPAGGLREIGNAAAPPTGRIDPNSITTGPPFVSPPPRSRYPTSPYNTALFQSVAYQRTLGSQAPLTSGGIQLVNTQSAVPTPPATAGIYPTSYQCQPSATLPAGANTAYVPPTLTPDLAPNIYSANNVGLRPLVSLGQENYNVQLGRGIIGQPTVYVPRQPIRNFFRYIFP